MSVLDEIDILLSECQITGVESEYSESNAEITVKDLQATKSINAEHWTMIAPFYTIGVKMENVIPISPFAISSLVIVDKPPGECVVDPLSGYCELSKLHKVETKVAKMLITAGLFDAKKH